MVRNELGKTLLKEVTREIRHLRRAPKEAAGENSAKNNMNFLGESEVMLREVGVVRGRGRGLSQGTPGVEEPEKDN